MNTGDVYNRINEVDDATVGKIIRRLESRDGNPTFTRWRDAYLDKLPLKNASRVLDAGCGTGVVTRAIAKRASSTCQIIGSDYSPALVNAAQQNAKELNLGGRIDFQVNDIHSLEFADGYFDVVIAHTVVSHVTDPVASVKELARVVKPGGLVAIFDGDYASQTFAHPDDELAQRVEAAYLKAVVNNPRVMRNLPQMLSSVGLEIVEVSSHVLTEVGTSSFWMSAIETYAPMIASSSSLSEDEINSWFAWQRQSAETGQFFGASNYYTYITRRTDHG
jgi:ubiquinone/menaquinone biosynthesis C-methylase UbiE